MMIANNAYRHNIPIITIREREGLYLGAYGNMRVLESIVTGNYSALRGVGIYLWGGSVQY